MFSQASVCPSPGGGREVLQHQMPLDNTSLPPPPQTWTWDLVTTPPSRTWTWDLVTTPPSPPPPRTWTWDLVTTPPSPHGHGTWSQHPPPPHGHGTWSQHPPPSPWTWDLVTTPPSLPMDMGPGHNTPPIPRTMRRRAVRILLECILVKLLLCVCLTFNGSHRIIFFCGFSICCDVIVRKRFRMQTIFSHLNKAFCY